MSEVEVRLDGDGEIDEIVADAVPVHIEMMDYDEVSLHIGNRLFTIAAHACVDTAWLRIVDLDAGFGDGPLPAAPGATKGDRKP